MLDKIIKLFSYIIAKLISVRLLVTLLFVGTYCKILLFALKLVESKVMSLETFLGLMAGFTPLVILIVEWYFKRKDRQKQDDDNPDESGKK